MNYGAEYIVIHHSCNTRLKIFLVCCP